MSLRVNPNPLIPNQPGTLSYTNSSIVQVATNSYVLKDINNNYVSSTIINGYIISSIASTQSISLMTCDTSGNIYHSNNYTANNGAWVASQNKIYKTSPSGGVPTAIVFSGTQPTLYCVTGLAFDSSGALYLTSRPTSSTGCVYRCVYSSSTGQYTATKIITSGTVYPTGMVISSSNYIYISDKTYNSVIRYPPSTGGTVSGTTIITGLTTPYGLTLDSTQSNIYIGNFGNAQILKYPIGGGTKVIYYTFTSGTQPYGIVMDSNNNLYVNDFNYQKTYKLLPATTYSASSIAGTVTQIYTMSQRPTGINLYSTSGNLYILINNSGSNAYQIFSYYYPSTFKFQNVKLSITQYNLSIWNTTYNTKIVSNLIVYTGTNYFTTGSNDIFSIFSPIQYGYTGPYASTTNYQVTGTDLNKVFIPYVSGTISNTNYQVYTKDLNTIFQPIQYTKPFNILSGTYTYSYDYMLGKYFINFSSTGSIQFTNSIGTIYTIVVGGGGSGGGSGNGSQYCGGGGGGGGAILTSTTTSTGLPLNTTFNITIGSGAVGNGGAGTTGGNTTLSSSSGNLIVCTGGLGGQVGSTTATINGGSSGSCTTLNSNFINVSNGSSGGNGGASYNGINYYGASGNSSTLSTYYFTNSIFTNTLYIYNYTLFSGGGGGGNEGSSSDGFAAYGGNGLSNTTGGLGGWTTNTNYLTSGGSYNITSSAVSWGQNNMPSYSNSSTVAYSGFAPGGGGGGVGTLVTTKLGGSGSKGCIKFMFDYIYPPVQNTNIFRIANTNNVTYSYNYTTTGNPYYLVTFSKGSNTITFNQAVTATIICVGGGGGGGGGFYTSTTSYGSGSGGGGGGAAIIASYALSAGSYTVSVGSGGMGGNNGNGESGTATSLGSIISSTGGGNGYKGVLNTVGSGNAGLAGTVTTSATYRGGSGGVGGQGTNGSVGSTSQYMSTSGSSSTLISTTLPDNTVCYFSGGGGGGSQKYTTNGQTNPYGGSPGWGYGGLVGYSGTNNGGNAYFYGSGGGGGAAQSIAPTTLGGNGGNGILIIYFYV